MKGERKRCKKCDLLKLVKYFNNGRICDFCNELIDGERVYRKPYNHGDWWPPGWEAKLYLLKGTHKENSETHNGKSGDVKK